MSKALIQRSRFFFVLVVVCLSAIGIGARLSNRKQAQSNRPQSDPQKWFAEVERQRIELARTLNVDDIPVVNKASHFNVSHRTLSPGGVIQFTLRNDYPKPITAYKTILGEDGAELADMVLATYDASIVPGGSADVLLTVTPNLKAQGVVISAVLFADGTADGDPEAIRELQEYRLGESMQMELARSLLSRAARASADHLPDALDSVLSRIQAATVRFRNANSYPEGYRPESIAGGARVAEGLVSESLDMTKKELQTDRTAGITRLEDLINFVNDKSTLLREYLRQAKMKAQ